MLNKNKITKSIGICAFILSTSISLNAYTFDQNYINEDTPTNDINTSNFKIRYDDASGNPVSYEPIQLNSINEQDITLLQGSLRFNKAPKTSSTSTSYCFVDSGRSTGITQYSPNSKVSFSDARISFTSDSSCNLTGSGNVQKAYDWYVFNGIKNSRSFYNISKTIDSERLSSASTSYVSGAAFRTNSPTVTDPYSGSTEIIVGKYAWHIPTIKYSHITPISTGSKSCDAYFGKQGGQWNGASGDWYIYGSTGTGYFNRNYTSVYWYALKLSVAFTNSSIVRNALYCPTDLLEAGSFNWTPKQYEKYKTIKYSCGSASGSQTELGTGFIETYDIQKSANVVLSTSEIYEAQYVSTDVSKSSNTNGLPGISCPAGTAVYFTSIDNRGYKDIDDAQALIQVGDTSLDYSDFKLNNSPVPTLGSKIGNSVYLKSTELATKVCQKDFCPKGTTAVNGTSLCEEKIFKPNIVKIIPKTLYIAGSSSDANFTYTVPDLEKYIAYENNSFDNENNLQYKFEVESDNPYLSTSINQVDGKWQLTISANANDATIKSKMLNNENVKTGFTLKALKQLVNYNSKAKTRWLELDVNIDVYILSTIYNSFEEQVWKCQALDSDDKR